jgi:hypothetical protein
MKRTVTALASALWLSVAGAGCQPGPDAVDPERTSGDVERGKADSSAEATFLTFEWDGELVASSVWNTKSTIQDQLLYTIGHLNGDRAVGRLDKLELTNVKSSSVSDGTRVTYHAKMSVAWGSKTNLPTKYSFTLPRKVDSAALEAFTSKYLHSCVDWGAHDVDSGSMWYYYRPKASGCTLDAADVVKAEAAVSVSPNNTNGKYPEYDRVWADNELRVVAIFGKYEDGATTTSDAGIAGWNAFIKSVKQELPPYQLATVPANVADAPGVSVNDVTFTGTLAGGKKVIVNALLVDNVSSASETFYARYNSLSTRADVIIYNGHAGLGQNVRALARRGSWVAGQYLILFMNGCDTFAYVDGYLAQTRAAINPDDPTGTKYMDIVTNGMPAFFNQMPRASLALVRGLMKTSAPLTYQQMFANIDSAQVVLVTGEEDNVYTPGAPQSGGGSTGFAGLREQGDVDQNEELLYQVDAPAGQYLVKLTEEPGQPGGDADLYVKVGARPSTTSYDCRPYLDGSNEECKVTLSQAGTIYVTVRGYAAKSYFRLTVDPLNAPAPTWSGLDVNGTVTRGQEKRYETPSLVPGRYRVELSGTGDADLYVRKGSAPTTTTFDCRPYKSGSAEVCSVTLDAAAPLHIMVRGYASTSTFRLVAKPE